MAGVDDRDRRPVGRSASTTHRRGQSMARVMPMRGVTVDALGRRSGAGSTTADVPLKVRSMPERAAQPTRARGAAAGRRRRRRTDRRSTAWPSPSAGDDVDAVVHPVDEVHVELAGGPEHHRVARRAAAEGVARRIVAAVRLDLGDRPRCRPRREHLAEQLGRDVRRVAGEERPSAGDARVRSRRRAGTSCSECLAAARPDEPGTGSADRRPAPARRRPAVIRALHRHAGRDQRSRVGTERRVGVRRARAATPARRAPGAPARRRSRARRGTGVPRCTSHSARSVADDVSASAAACIRSGTNVAVAIMPVIAPSARRT